MSDLPSLASRWEQVARLVTSPEDFEQNALDLGHVLDSDAYYAECIAQACASPEVDR